ncbi:MAG: deoxynucleoside kinase [Anaerolineae bacterium]
MAERFYVAVEGAIGVGKTTLARLIQDEFEAELLLEVFEENPFLPLFYQDPERHAFQAQVYFLLSRYGQQQDIPESLQRGNLISDYTFAKDRIFALLNLSGEELEMYERIHRVLAQGIAQPDLVVYLRAETDVLMQRIASRDRSFERTMDRGYIHKLNLAYEGFFSRYPPSEILPIDTPPLDFVRDQEDRRSVARRIRSALEEGAYQRRLPQMEQGSESP